MKTIVITGGSSGIGRETALQLAELGHKVIAIGRNEARLASLVSQYHTIEIINADVATQEGRQAIKNYLADRNVDVLVNNAGIMELKPLAKADTQHVDRQIDVNLKGTINALREAAVRLNNGGRVINFSTSVIGLKLENYGVYAATKAAVETLTAIMAKEMRGKEITVNAVAPGPTATELFLNGKSDELIDRMAKMNPLERLGIPDDIASVVSFLASTDGAWVNGQVLRANGGVI